MTIDEIETGKVGLNPPLSAFDSLLYAETQIGLQKISLDRIAGISHSNNLS